MTVSYGFDRMKVLQALRYHFINKKDIRILLIAVNVLAIISGILFFLKKIEPTVFVLTSLLWIVLMIVFWFLMPRLIYSRTQEFKDNFITAIDEDSVTLQKEAGSRVWKFTDFKSWFESPYFFHLYVGPNAFFIIPKDPFSTEQLQTVRSLFKQNIPAI